MNTAARVKVESELEVTKGTGMAVWHVLRVPRSAVEPLELKGNLRRVVCTLNGVETFNCSLFPSKGDYFITMNKKLRDTLGLVVGDAVTVELIKDTSKYGMPMPEEFAEVLRQDSEGDELFNLLSPGNQRLLLKLIVAVRDVDKRIARGLVGIELLKRDDGRFDYHAQHTAMKNVV